MTEREFLPAFAAVIKDLSMTDKVIVMGPKLAALSKSLYSFKSIVNESHANYFGEIYETFLVVDPDANYESPRLSDLDGNMLFEFDEDIINNML